MGRRGLGALLVSVCLGLAVASSPASATNYSFTAEGPWYSNDGLLSGTWFAHFDVAGYDLSGTLDIIGLPDIARGNISGTWDLQELGFGVMFVDQELISFTGGLQGDEFVGSFESGDISGVWSGLLDRLSLTSDPIIPVLNSSLPTLFLSSIDGDVGDIVKLSATLFSLGEDIAEITNIINFDPSNTPILALLNGKPNCKVNPLIDKADTLFEFLPAGCSGSSCTQVRAIVQSLSNLAPIVDGSMLYSCKVKINKEAVSGIYQIVATALEAIDTDSILVEITSFIGEIKVKLNKWGCHCSTVETAGSLPLASLLAPFALLVLRRRSRKHTDS